jgi:hypothetical protein
MNLPNVLTKKINHPVNLFIITDYQHNDIFSMATALPDSGMYINS